MDKKGRLSFFEKNNFSGIITNTLMINSSRIKFTFKFFVESIKLPEKTKTYKRRTKSEAFTFLFGPRSVSYTHLTLPTKA